MIFLPFPSAYSALYYILFAVAGLAVGSISYFTYGFLYRKEILCENEETLPAGKLDFLLLSLSGIAVAVAFSLFSINISIPVASFSVCAFLVAALCEKKNGFIPLFSNIIIAFFSVINNISLFFAGGVSFIFRALLGALTGGAVFFIIKFISGKIKIPLLGSGFAFFFIAVGSFCGAVGFLISVAVAGIFTVIISLFIKLVRKTDFRLVFLSVPFSPFVFISLLAVGFTGLY